MTQLLLPNSVGERYLLIRRLEKLGVDIPQYATMQKLYDLWHKAVGDRNIIAKRLRELGCLVPGWESLPISQLQDILDKQEAQKKKEVRAPMPVSQRKEIGKQLRELREYKKLRASGSQHKFF